VKGLEAKMPPESHLRLVVTASGFEAGIQAENAPPDCVIVDFDIGSVEALQMCQNLRRNPNLSETVVVAVGSNGHGLSSSVRSVVDETITKPLDPALLAERTRSLLRERQRT
jgi:DNA-binding response OmpR family regulator